MSNWDGWSTSQTQVDATRILRGLLNSVEGPQTTKTTQQVIDELGLTDADPTRVMALYGWIFKDSEGITSATEEQLELDSYGPAIMAEFELAAGRTQTNVAARRAVLMWLMDQGADEHSVNVQGLREAPHGWFYGRQFTEDQVAKAASNLEQRGFMTAVRTQQGLIRAELTASGVKCVEQHGGDPDTTEERGQMTGGGVTIQGDFINNQGNAAVGSTVGSQTSTSTVVNHLTMGMTAVDLVAIIRAVRESEGFPEDETEEAADVESALVAAGAGTEEEATAAVGRAKRFFQRLAKLTGPAVSAGLTTLATAGGNYAALQLGLPTAG